MKTIICGGRDYQLTDLDRGRLDVLRTVLPITEVVCGGATGADAGGEDWARSHDIPVTPKAADWDNITAPGAVIRTRRDGTKYNVLAGFWRNQVMADYAQACICFPGGTGTADMRERAEARNLRVVVIGGPEQKYIPKQGRL